jgi:hypothetical protein
MKPYLRQMVARMQKRGIHDAIRRSVVRFLQCADIPEAHLGPVANVCFEFLSALDAGIVYDPDNTGTRLPSLGVHEHWNNMTERKYSRNLGTGDGIELLAVERNVTSVWENGPAARSFRLYPGYPNPFNPGTVISYDITEQTRVSLAVYDVRGQVVAQLVDGQQASGRHSVKFDGSRLASGVYLCRVQAGASAQTQRLLLIK